MNKDEIVKSLTVQAYKQFPEIKGIKPQVRWTSKPDIKQTCTLTFQTTLTTITGNKMNRRIKVVGSEDGKILKVSTTK